MEYWSIEFHEKLCLNDHFSNGISNLRYLLLLDVQIFWLYSSRIIKSTTVGYFRSLLHLLSFEHLLSMLGNQLANRFSNTKWFDSLLFARKRFEFGCSNLTINIHIIWCFLFWILNQITKLKRKIKLSLIYIVVHVSLNHLNGVCHISIKLLLLSQTEMDFSVLRYLISYDLPSQSYNHSRAWILCSF